jgi:O-antigen ligase
MKFLRLGIFVLIGFGVLSHGAVEEWARAVLETGAGLLFLAWAVRAWLQRQEHAVLPPLLFPLVALALFALAQIVFRLTVSPFHTRSELQLLLAFILLMFLIPQAFRSAPEWRTLIWFLMTLGFAVAIFAILQHLTFNGKLYWFREMRYGGIPFGPYVNRNHFAGFAEMIIPVSLVPLIMARVRRERWLIVILFALLPMGALFLSASRGGIISLGAELVFIALVLGLRRTGLRHVLAGALVLVLAFLFVSWLGARQVLDRFSSMQALEVTAGKRASMRHGTWAIFLDHRIFGTGLGTLQIVYPPYETFYDARIVNHAHNDYLEALAETGVIGGATCAAFVAMLFGISLRQLLQRDKPFAASLHLSGLAACSALLVHSFVDFNLHIPGNALLFFVMASMATAQLEDAKPSAPARAPEADQVPDPVPLRSRAFSFIRRNP